MQHAHGLSLRRKDTCWVRDSRDKLIHLEDSCLFYCTYVCLFFKMTLLLITRPISAPRSYEIDSSSVHSRSEAINNLQYADVNNLVCTSLKRLPSAALSYA